MNTEHLPRGFALVVVAKMAVIVNIADVPLLSNTESAPKPEPVKAPVVDEVKVAASVRELFPSRSKGAIKLPASQKSMEMLELFNSGHTIPEIATAYNCSAPNVDYHLRRAREEMKKRPKSNKKAA